MSKPSASANTASSRLAEANDTTTLSPARIGCPPSSQSAVAVLRNVITGVHQRSISSAAAGISPGSARSASCASGCSSSAMQAPGRPLRIVSLPATANSQNMFSNSSTDTRPPSSSTCASRIDITSSPGRRRLASASRCAYAYRSGMPSRVRGSGIRPLASGAGRSASASAAIGVPRDGSNAADAA